MSSILIEWEMARSLNYPVQKTKVIIKIFRRLAIGTGKRWRTDGRIPHTFSLYTYFLRL